MNPHAKLLTTEFEALREAIKEFVRQCPDFPNGELLAGNIGRKMANVESTLRDCWELRLPSASVSESDIPTVPKL